MADIMNLKVTCVEGVDQFHADGEAELVQRLLKEWRERVEALKAKAMEDYERMKNDFTRGAPPAATSGPVGPDPTSPFGRRR